MPLPKPKVSETKPQFIYRCMGDSVASKEFPDNPQRYAICRGLYDRKNSTGNNNINEDKGEVVANITTRKAEIVSNVVARTETLDGVRYMVLPVVLLVEGVHNGTAGAWYYSTRVIQNCVDLWNNRPIPVYHPTDSNGLDISANSIEILRDWVVGNIHNIEWKDNKLKGELWINTVKVNSKFPGLLDMIKSNKMEVSTGLSAMGDNVSGTWNGIEYDFRVDIIFPDHLALLPHGTGACSWEDGCGVRNAKNTEGKEVLEMAEDKKDLETETEAKDQDDSTHCCEERIEAVIANTNNNLQESDKEWMMSLDVEAYERLEEEIFKTTNVNTKEEKEDKKVAEKTEDKTVKVEPEGNTLVVTTLAEFISNAPEKFRDELEQGMELYQEARNSAIEVILANEKNTFTKEQLEVKDIAELKSIVALAEVKEEAKKDPNDDKQPTETTDTSTGDFSGRTGNTEKSESTKVLPLPSLAKAS